MANDMLKASRKGLAKLSLKLHLIKEKLLLPKS